MAKKKKSRSEKEVARLRREVEILRAQLVKEEKSKPSPTKVEKVIENVNEVKIATLEASEKSYDYVRQGLKKTAILAIVTMALLIGLYFSQSQWSKLFP